MENNRLLRALNDAREAATGIFFVVVRGVGKVHVNQRINFDDLTGGGGEFLRLSWSDLQREYTVIASFAAVDGWGSESPALIGAFA